jgi:hypothetical protein
MQTYTVHIYTSTTHAQQLHAHTTYHKESLPQFLHDKEAVHVRGIFGLEQTQRILDQDLSGAQMVLKHLLHTADELLSLVKAQGQRLVDLVHVDRTEAAAEEIHRGR